MSQHRVSKSAISFTNQAGKVACSLRIFTYCSLGTNGLIMQPIPSLLVTTSEIPSPFLEKKDMKQKTWEREKTFSHLNLTVWCEAKVSFAEVLLIHKKQKHAVAHIYNLKTGQLKKLPDPPTEANSQVASCKVETFCKFKMFIL